VASGRGTHSGVLFKDASAIETLRDTGTLTAGKPSLTERVSFDGQPRKRLLALADELGIDEVHVDVSPVDKAAMSLSSVPVVSNALRLRKTVL
jgi:Cu+-exporting ATPase